MQRGTPLSISRFALSHSTRPKLIELAPLNASEDRPSPCCSLALTCPPERSRILLGLGISLIVWFTTNFLAFALSSHFWEWAQRTCPTLAKEDFNEFICTPHLLLIFYLPTSVITFIFLAGSLVCVVAYECERFKKYRHKIVFYTTGAGTFIHMISFMSGTDKISFFPSQYFW